MNKQLHPKLRFPEFSDEWESDKFKSFVKLNQGLQIPISERLTEYVPNSYFYITNEFLNKNTKKSYFIVNPSNSVICNESDILMTRTGNTGKVVTNVNGAFHNNFFKISYNSNVYKNYLYYYLTHPRIQHIILSRAGTSTIPDLNHSDFYSINFVHPSLPEQQKIANYLTIIDKKIELLTEKKTALSRYKKAMMQKLFSQEIRFKPSVAEALEAYPEWEEKRLGEIFVENKDKVGKSNISTYSISAGKGFVSQEEKFGRDISGAQNSNYVVLQKGDLAYNKGNSKTYKFGCVYKSDFEFLISVPNVFICFRADLSIVEPQFYAKLFENKYLDPHLRKIISSGARMDGLLNVSKDDFFKIKVPFPHLLEQQKIADFLSSIDESITKVEEQIKETQNFKKAMLQQMFV